MIPATLGQRAIARCLDFVVLLLLLAGSFAGFTDKGADGTTTFDVPWWWVVLVLVAMLAFEVVPVHVRGQTPGKILGMSPILSLAVLPVLAVIYGTALLDRGGRSVLDKLAGTRVVQAR